MAENKKSFILYCDYIHMFKKMPDDLAGKLIKHVLEYVNDNNPTTDEMMVDILFEPIKQQLKRDLQKYENVAERNKTNGAKGGRPKKHITQNNPVGLIGNPNNPKKPDTVTDTVTDNVTDNVNDNKNNIIKFISSFPDYENLIKKDEVFIRNLFQELTGKWTFLELNDLHRDLGQKLINYKFYCDKYKIKLKDNKHIKNSFKKFALSHWNKNTTQIMNLK